MNLRMPSALPTLPPPTVSSGVSFISPPARLLPPPGGARPSSRPLLDHPLGQRRPHLQHGNQLLLTLPPPTIPPPNNVPSQEGRNPITLRPGELSMASTAGNILRNSSNLISPTNPPHPGQIQSKIKGRHSFLSNGGYHSHGNGLIGTILSPKHPRTTSTTSTLQHRPRNAGDRSEQNRRFLYGRQLSVSQDLFNKFQPQKGKELPKVCVYQQHQVNNAKVTNSLAPDMSRPPPTIVSFHNHNKRRFQRIEHSSQRENKKMMPQSQKVVGFQVPLKTYSPVAGSTGDDVEGKQSPKGTDDGSKSSTKEKTPMCLINEVARFNKTTHQYRLMDEAGPAHRKSFTLRLKLGDSEEYVASGPSIKKAQQAAATVALEKTALKHPPPRVKPKKNPVVPPTVELNALAMKRGVPTVYRFLDSLPGDDQKVVYQTPKTLEEDSLAAAGDENFQPILKANATNVGSNCRPQSRIKTGTGSKFPFVVSVNVGESVFYGQGSTSQAAKHAAAANALRLLRPLNPNCGSNVKSNLNPSSAPFVPAAIATAVSSVSASPSTCLSTEDDSAVAVDQFDDIKSPVTLVHERALKRNLAVRFELVKETGPPHMRIFVTKCAVGDILTVGEGSGKRSSKARSAELMIKHLKTLPPIASCSVPLNKSSSRKSRKPKNLIKVEQKENPQYGRNINPISRLAQIQQAKKEKEPVYTLIAENGMPRRREFVINVSASGQTASASGRSKKLAKRAAAELLLQLLGYCKPSPLPGKSALKSSSSSSTTLSAPVSSNDNHRNDCGLGSSPSISILQHPTEKAKKLTFLDDLLDTPSESGLTPGDVNEGAAEAGNVKKNDAGNKDVSTSVLDNDSSAGAGSCDSTDGRGGGSEVVSSRQGVAKSKTDNSACNGDLESTKASFREKVSPNEELDNLSKLLGFEVTYKVFPQKDQSADVVTLVKLTTDPPKVCHGSGKSIEESQNDAACKALVLIVDEDCNQNLENIVVEDGVILENKMLPVSSIFTTGTNS